MNVPDPKVEPDLKSVSPSQLKEFRLCPRKWWLNKRAKIPQPEEDHLIVGTAAHDAMEGYYSSGGKPFDPAEFSAKRFPDHEARRDSLKTALQSAQVLLRDPAVPKPKPGILLEVPRNYVTGLKIGGVALRQRSDLLDPTDLTCAQSWDWKTSGSVFSDYTKTGEQLRIDEQAICYSKEAFEKFKPDAVEFHHGVMGTKNVEADVISTDPMTKEFVDDQFKALEDTVGEMRRGFAIDNFHLTPVGRGAPSASWGSPCRAFKGCPYVAYCGVELTSYSNTPPPTEGSSTMTEPSLKERLAAKQRATGINPPDAAKPAPVTPYVPPVGEAKTERIAALQTAFTAILDELRALGVR